MLKNLSRVIAAALLFGAALLETSSAIAAPPLAARTSDEAGVRVVVTPKTVARDAKVWEFTVVMDTHTNPLNDNLAQAAALVDNAGRRTVPTGWQGDPPGHHRKGILQFSAPAEMPKSIELRITGVGGVAMRTFRWEIE